MNLVEITVRADSRTAKLALDEIKGKLTELTARSSELRLKLDGDVKAQAQLAALNARVMELRDRIRNMSPLDIKGVARAQAQLMMLLATMKRLEDQANNNNTWLSRMHAHFQNMSQSGGRLSGIIGNLGSTFTSSGAAAAGSLPALAAVVAAILAMIGVISALISEFGAATIALGAFAAFAVPTFMKIFSGIQAVSAAADKLNTDKLTKGISDAQIAADRLAQSKAWAGIPTALQPAVRAALSLKDTFDKMANSMQPQVSRIFAEALKGIANILPQLMPLARVAGTAIEGLLKDFDKFTKSNGFSSFLAQMQTIAGPAITAIGHGLGQLVISLGKFLQVAASPQGLMILKGAFAILTGAVNILTWAVQQSQNQFVSIEKVGASVASSMIRIARWIDDAFLTMVGHMAGLAAKIPGPWDASMKRLSASINATKANADIKFSQMLANISAFSTRVSNMTPIFHLQANITDLQNKLAIARGLLNDHNLTKTRRAAVEADISRLAGQLAIARAELAALVNQSYTVYVNYATVNSPTGTHYGHPQNQASGGITGAASGGIRNRFTRVAEHGRELVGGVLIDAAPGTSVRSNPDTERILSDSAHRGKPTVLRIDAGSSDIDRLLLKILQKVIRVDYQGDIILAFGGS